MDWISAKLIFDKKKGFFQQSHGIANLTDCFAPPHHKGSHDYEHECGRFCEPVFFYIFNSILSKLKYLQKNLQMLQ